MSEVVKFYIDSGTSFPNVIYSLMYHPESGFLFAGLVNKN